MGESVPRRDNDGRIEGIDMNNEWWELKFHGNSFWFSSATLAFKAQQDCNGGWVWHISESGLTAEGLG